MNERKLCRERGSKLFFPKDIDCFFNTRPPNERNTNATPMNDHEDRSIEKLNSIAESFSIKKTPKRLQPKDRINGTESRLKCLILNIIYFCMEKS